MGAVILSLFLLASFASMPAFVTGIQFALFDAYQRFAPRVPKTAHTLIVAIDQKSLEEIGQWPWPRTVMSDLIDALAKLGPAAIGVDLLFPEPDRMSPASIAEIVARVDLPLSRRLAKLPGNDAQLADVLKRHPIALGVAGTQDREPAKRSAGHGTPFRLYGGDPRPFLRTFPDTLRSLAMLDSAAPGHGLISVDPGEGVIRSVPMLASADGVLIAALSLEVLRLASNNAGYSVTTDQSGVRDIRIGDLILPTDATGSIWVHFSPHDPSRFVSAVDVLRGRIDPDDIKGVIALIGATGIGLLDYKSTPLGEQVPGVEIHAQILEGIFDNSLLRRPQILRHAEGALILLCGIILLVAIPAVRPRYSALIYLGLMAGLSALGFMLYYSHQLLLSIVLPAAATNVLFGVVLSGTLIDADRQRRALRRTLETERETAARAAGELEAARRIQIGMLPPATAEFLGDPRLSLQALIEPARSVGGDLYDFFKLDEDQLFFMIGDVAGKGLPASMFMAVSKVLYKSAALRREAGADVAQIMRAANAEISRDNPESFFVTAVAAILDLRDGRVDFCIAGHDPPVSIRQPSGPAVRLEGEAGPPLCVRTQFAYRSHTHHMLPGEILCLFTDGVTEAMNDRSELFGLQRLMTLLGTGAQSGDSPGILVNSIRDAVREFVGSTERSDDLTILALRWNGAGTRDS